ncbi:MAG TPA: ABC transporter ATP-binding protein [Anaerolineales bacterium]|nr:ABC transporter ATP-binding protein [Anaerolineales bacterium]
MQVDEPLIRVKDLSRHYQMGGEVVRALDGINLSIYQGQFVGITGPSGSGKSTLLYVLGGLDRPTTGTVEIAGTEISKLTEDQLSRHRGRTVGFIFQQFNLIATMSALDNVAFPLVFSGVSLKERNERASRLLEMVGLGDRQKHKPVELSGGQQQRVSIARALVSNPAVVMADEPTGNLDSKSSRDVMEILTRLNREEGRTIILVTHDYPTLQVTSRQVLLRDGQVVADHSGDFRSANFFNLQTSEFTQ